MAQYKTKQTMVKLRCSECKRINYYTRRNKKTTEKLQLRKYCKWCRKHTLHKETK